jgi:hypothetical protein
VILRQFHGLAIERDRRRSLLGDDDELLVERLRRIHRVRTHLDALEQRTAAPAERADHAGCDGDGGQRARFHRLTIGERHRHAHARHFARAALDVVLLDDAAVGVGPLRTAVRTAVRIAVRAAAGDDQRRQRRTQMTRSPHKPSRTSARARLRAKRFGEVSP